MKGFCDYDNELPVSIKGGKLVDQWNNHHLVQKDIATSG